MRLLSPLTWFPLLAVLICTLPGAARAGEDTVFLKPDGKQSWGGILADMVGYSGYEKSYALVVGVSQFDDPSFADLPTGSDPVKVKDFLLNEAGFDYVHLLTEENVTVARLTDLMVDEFPERLDSNDRFVFYWSGHGVTRGLGSGARGYLPIKTSPDGKFGRMISMQDIKRWDGLIEARQSLYLLDSCFGGLAGSAAQSTGRISKIDLLSEKSSHLLTAGTAEQRTIAIDAIGGSVFTHAVLEGLKGNADAANAYPRDGVVTLNELKGYVESRVDQLRTDAGWQATISPQVRDLRTSQGEFYFMTSAGKEDRLEDAGFAPSGAFDFGVPVPQSGGQPLPPPEQPGPMTVIYRDPGPVHIGDENFKSWPRNIGKCYPVNFVYDGLIETIRLDYDIYGAETTSIVLNGVVNGFESQIPMPGKKRPNHWDNARSLRLPVNARIDGPIALRICSQEIVNKQFEGDMDDFMIRNVQIVVNSP